MESLTTLICIIIFLSGLIAAVLDPGWHSLLSFSCVCLLCYLDWLSFKK